MPGVNLAFSFKPADGVEIGIHAGLHENWLNLPDGATLQLLAPELRLERPEWNEAKRQMRVNVDSPRGVRSSS